ncbi:MAG TPA: flagellar hook-basal body complex protein [Paucimonas sp.]|nr:flagellar hook-basal body complex protein [Paucimonas sp.]
MPISTLYIGLSGLQAAAKAFNVAGNNTANMNTAGFKSQSVMFSDLFQRDAGQSGGQMGSGVNIAATSINLDKAGELQKSDRSLDLAVDGNGFFILRDEEHQQTSYTRDGRVDFKDGYLVSLSSGDRVAGMNEAGQLIDISIADLQFCEPKHSENVTLKGNLAKNATKEVVVDGVKIVDPSGLERVIKLTFKKSATSDTDWTVTASDAEGAIDTGGFLLQFSGADPVESASKLKFQYAPAGADAFEVTLDFGAVKLASVNVTPPAEPASTVAFDKHDGHAAGMLKEIAIDGSGVVNVTYTNGQKKKGPQLALARFASDQDVAQQGGGRFTATDPQGVSLGRPGSDGFGGVLPNRIEGSNVQLEAAFGDIILYQRLFQSAGKVVQTANEMVQSLYDLDKR